VLHIHRAERADRLLDGLASVLCDPLADPLQPEVIAVPTRGVERWLAQRLSARLGTSRGRGDGICANVDFPFPARLVGGATAAATGVPREEDPWLPERSVWPLLEAVDAAIDQPWLATLKAHIRGGAGAEEGRTRRFAVVRHLADLYDRYGVHRPEMLQAWSAGDDTDDGGQRLPGDVAWQARLWRELRGRIDAPSPAERLDEACRRLRAGDAPLELPARVSLFGLTRLPASFLQVLNAIAERRDVHLFLLHPSPALWDRVERHLSGAALARRRSADPTATLPSNPLLSSWGRDVREMQLVVTGSATSVRWRHWPSHDMPDTLLRRLQAGVRGDMPPVGPPLSGEADSRVEIDPRDDSLTVHSCHGRARQVEVVRDAILHLLATHPHLEPRDVIVMCPDVEAFAPLVHAAFGAGTSGLQDDEGQAVGTRPEGLRVRLADRSLRQTNPVLRVVAEVLELVDARLTASQVLDLADREPVRRRFGFDDDDLQRAAEWVAAAGIRWGYDAAHREPYKLADLEANTWRAGLRRLLSGVAMSEDLGRLLAGTLPLDDVGSGDIDLAGRLVEYVERLSAALDALRGPQRLAEWAAAIGAAADALTVSPGAVSWERSQLERLLDDVVAESAGSPVELTLAELRTVFGDRLRGRPTRANFRTGHLTICTLVPMRSVPHKVVCLLGLDDGHFPRRTAVDGDDIIDRDPNVGDRDPRSEDRQLLLDALMAATEHLVIAYTGRDERTNAERPPAVPIGELLDNIDATVRLGSGHTPARDAVVVHHPLQPFDRRNFTGGALIRDRRWSFDDVALAGARALVAGPAPTPPFLREPLARQPSAAVELADLEAFLRHPVRAFLRRRLGVSVAAGEDVIDDALPVDLDPLQQWQVGQRLLEARRAGGPVQACVAAEIARGTLPPGTLGLELLARIVPQVDEIVSVASAVVDPAATSSIDINVQLDGDLALLGTVPDVAGDCIANVTYSRVGAKHRLVAWARLLAATAAHPERPLHAVTVGKRISKGRGVSVVRIAELDATPAARQRVAVAELATLVDLFQRAMCEPLPLYCDTSFAYANAVNRNWDPHSNANQMWASTFDREREDVEPEHQLVLGGVVTLPDLLRADPRQDECGEGWAPDEESRFGRYARRLWEPLLRREEVTAA
jgi:exodeoxyribonuclease V gamma subunit